MLHSDDLVWDPDGSAWVPVTIVIELAKPADSESIDSIPVAPTPLPLKEIGDFSLDNGSFPAVLTLRQPESYFRYAVIGALILHILFITLGSFYAFKTEPVRPLPVTEPPPLQVEMVEEAEPPPPPPPPPPRPPQQITSPPVPIPPPPDLSPPPPPAPPIVPIEQPPIQPPAPMQSMLPQSLPQIAPVPPPVSTPPAPLQPQTAHLIENRPPVPPQTPVSNEPQDVGQSDYLYAPPPDYPYNARRLRQTGRVIIFAHVDSNGDTTSVSVGVSSGVPALDQAARTAVANYRFRVKSARVLRVPISFQL